MVFPKCTETAVSRVDSKEPSGLQKPHGPLCSVTVCVSVHTYVYRCVFMCVCVNACGSVSVWMWAHVCTDVCPGGYVHMCTQTCACVSTVWVCAQGCAGMFTCVHVCKCAQMCIRVGVCTGVVGVLQWRDREGKDPSKCHSLNSSELLHSVISHI